MASDRTLRRLVVTLIGDHTETIPVASRYSIPPLNETFVEIQAADKSTVIFRTSDIRMMHLKAPNTK